MQINEVKLKKLIYSYILFLFLFTLAGLLDYTVDLKEKEVTLTAIVDTEKRSTQDPMMNKNKHSCSRGIFRCMCLGAL